MIVPYRTDASKDAPANKGTDGDQYNTAKGDMEVSDTLHCGWAFSAPQHSFRSQETHRFTKQSSRGAEQD